MYFLENIRKQLLASIFAQAGEGAAAGPDDGFRGGQQETQTETRSPEQTQGLSAKEQELFNELNEKLDAIDNDSKFVTQYCGILGTFLAKVKNGDYPDLSPEDSDFQRLLTIYTRRFEELKDLRNQGQEIEHVIAMHMHKLDQAVDKGAGGEDIDADLDQAYYEEAIEREKQEELQTKYDGLKEALKMKLQAYIGKEELTPNMQRVVDEFKQSKFNIILEDYTDEEKLDYFKSGVIESLEELNRAADIAVRDEKIVGTEGEKLGNERLESSNEAYEKLIRGENKEELTEIGEALTSKNGKNTPAFEELQMNHIDILSDMGVDLAALFLVDQEGKSITGEIQEGQKYIINFGKNTHLAGKMDFAFIARNTQNIKVDGKALTFEENSFKVDGKTYPMKDGSLIEVGQSFEDKELPARTERHEKINELLNGYSVSDTQNQVISEAMASSEPLSAFEGMTIPNGIAGFIIMLVMKVLTGKEFEKNSETGEWEEVDPNNKPTNAEIIDGSVGSYYDGGTRIDINSDFEGMSEGVKGLVNIIYQKEARGNPNIIYSGCKIRPPKPITEMTVREVRKFQDQMVAEQNARGAKNVSSAVGAPQIIRKTMDWAISAGVLNPNEKFDVAAQNRFTLWQLNDVAGMKKYTEGTITDEQFLNGIAGVWASIPTSGGKSAHHGVAGNKSLISKETMLHYINKI